MKLLLLVVALVVALTSALPEEVADNTVRREPVVDFTLNEAKTSLTFKAYGRRWDFTVWDSEVSTDPQDAGLHFHGSLVGQEGDAAFTITPTWVSGMIMLPNNTLWLEATNPEKPESLSVHGFSDEHGVQHSRGFPWGKKTTTPPPPPPTPATTKPKNPTNVPKDKLKVIIFVDDGWLNLDRNPLWSDRDKMIALLNKVDALYVKEGLTGWKFTVPDKKGDFPRNIHHAYRGGINYDKPNSEISKPYPVNRMLEYFSRQVHRHIGSNKPETDGFYHVALWLVGINDVGIGYMRSACGFKKAQVDSKRCAAAGVPRSNRNEQEMVKNIAHQLGHTRGAKNDLANQCTEFAQDQDHCNCSVMSDCKPFTSWSGKFSSKSKREIKAYCP